VKTLIDSLLQTRLYDPFGLLGLHREAKKCVIRAFEPHATQVELINKSGSTDFKRINPEGLFEWQGEKEKPQTTKLF